MPEQNPFLVPTSPRAGDSRSVGAGRGVEWLREGWTLFVKNPAMWIAVTVVVLIVFVALSALGVFGSIAISLLYPVFSGGILIGCRELARGGELKFEHLFVGFKQKTQPLVVLGLYSLVANLAIALIAFVIVAGGSVSGLLIGQIAGAGVVAGSIALGMLVFLALSAPLAMALWFAPGIVVFRDASPVNAMKASFAACLHNIIPLFVFGVLAFAALLLAMLPMGLGLLVVLPVMAGSVYASYADIFD